MQPVQRFAPDTDLDILLKAMADDGAFIAENMFDAATIAAIREASDRFAEEVAPGSATQGMGDDGKVFAGANTVRFSSLARLTPAFFTMLDNELFHQVASALLLPTCGSYWLNTAQVMYIGPGEKAQALHRDADNWWEYVTATWPDSVEITISAMIGLDHVTEELGATRVVPASHRTAKLKQYDDLDTMPAELGPGDALVYSGYVQHGGGANLTTDRWRRAMHMSVVVGWLAPEEAAALDFQLGELDDQSERVQRMLGHRSYDPRPHRGGGLWLRHVKAIEDN